MMTYECVLGKIPFRIYSELDLGRIVINIVIIGFWWNKISLLPIGLRGDKRLHFEDNEEGPLGKNVNSRNV